MVKKNVIKIRYSATAQAGGGRGGIIYITADWRTPGEGQWWLVGG